MSEAYSEIFNMLVIIITWAALVKKIFKKILTKKKAGDIIISLFLF